MSNDIRDSVMTDRKVLALDSQALTAYQRCPRKYHFSFIRNIERKISKKSLDMGTLMHDMFEFVNKGLLEDKPLNNLCLDAVMQASSAELSTEDKMFVTKRFLEYFEHYSLQDSSYKLLSAEKGFSKIIYEDSEHLFVYEGRMDAVFYNRRENCLVWRDYKTRTGQNSWYHHVNQFYGYTWALSDDGECRGELDYIGKADKKTDKTFEREIVEFSKDQLERWKVRTINTFYKIVNDIDFEQNNSACEGKYGVCSFNRLCERDPLIHDQIIQIEYKEKERWAAW